MHAGIESWEDYYKNQQSVAKGGRGKEKDDYRRWEKRGREREIERRKDRGNACESGRQKEGKKEEETVKINRRGSRGEEPPVERP